jgi:hypothetical protein
MAIAQCPRCSDDVSLPDASAQATVSCPLCQEEFTLNEILDKMPPALVVITDPNPPIAAAATKVKESARIGGGFDFDDDDGDSGGFKLAPEEPSGAGFAFDEAAAPQKSGGSASRPRPKKKSKNPMFEMVKVILGGLIALPLAQLILWWAVPGGRDPVNIGPSISKLAPFIVPEKFHDPSLKAAAAGGTDNNAPNGEENDPARGTGGGSFAGVDTDNAPSGAFAPGGALNGGGNNPIGNVPTGNTPTGNIPTGNTPTGNTDPGAGDLTAGIGLDNPLSGVGEPENPLDPDNALIELPDEGDVPDPFAVGENTTGLPTPVQPAGGQLSGVKNGPEYAPQHLTDAVVSMVAKHRAMAAAEAPTQPMKIAFYVSVAELSGVVALLDMEDSENAAATKSLRTVAAEFFTPEILPILRGGGKGWLTHEERSTDGVALCGKVKTFSKSGKLFETVIELAIDNEVTVVSAIHPQDFVSVGKDAIVMARIVKDPSKNIVNYKGDEAEAVFAGMFISASE